MLIATLPVLLADFIVGTTERNALSEAARRNKSWLGGDTMLILGAIALVVLALLFWVAFLRQRPTHQRGSLVVTRVRKGENARYGSSGRRRRRRRRPDHPDNLGRNPTLGETGGLPPPRRDEDPGPPASASGASA